MIRIPFSAKALSAGLLISQAVFFLLMLRSNFIVHANLEAFINAGYLTVPNALVMPELTGLPAAFYGALFFTFTIGAGLCLAAMGLAWIYRRVFKASRWFLIITICIWLLLTIAVNIGGFSLAITAALVIIPPFVFFFVYSRMPEETGSHNRLGAALQVIVIILIAFAWFPKTDNDVFIDIRDHILLTNPAGKAINHFYYQYTLYPAKILKTPAQKLMASACLDGIEDQNLKSEITPLLIARDYLPINDHGHCDLYISQEGNNLHFSTTGKTVLESSRTSFLAAPGRILQQFSERSDSQSHFRTMTFFSLFTALPLSLFILVHGFFAILLFMIRKDFTRHAIASLLCLGIGVGTVFPLYFTSDNAMGSPVEIQAGLSSNDWREQRNALKAVLHASMDPLQFDIDERISSSQYIPVRYWFASALGNSRNPGAYNIMKRMLDDPHPNVVCMAYLAIGRSGRTQAIDEIKNRIATSDHWYVQWYAYRSLRQLGWTQQQ